MVATFIFSIISVGAFKILAEGLRYVRINQLAIDSQRAGLSVLSGVGSGIQSTRNELIEVSPQGVVFASPTKPDGTVEFDVAEQKLFWQKWVCYYYDGSSLSRRERDISPASTDPGTPPSPTSFAGDRVRKAFSDEVELFQVSQLSASPPIWSIKVVLGSLTDTDLYGIELQSEVGPRN